jgi:hypothetical protein
VKLALVVLASSIAVAAACGSSRTGFDPSAAPQADGGPPPSGGPTDADVPALSTDAPDAPPVPPPPPDPGSCEEAVQTHSNTGCDYWPTIAGNLVQPVFDFAVVVSNSGKAAAKVTVTGPNDVNVAVTVAPGALEKIYLPWVRSLKGPDITTTLSEINSAMKASVAAAAGAYHLVSSVPVVVYQFNPLEYRAAGGPPGKDWSADCAIAAGDPECLSHSNDASLLLPSTAWSTNYRVTGMRGWSGPSSVGPPVQDYFGTYVVLTGAHDGTNVTVSLAAAGTVLGGEMIGLPATAGGGTMSLTLDAGDVVELVTPKGATYDLSGSLVQSDKPIQVISGMQCTFLPYNIGSCDHLEETVLPAEALGKRYVVATPTAPKGVAGKHVVRFYGNRDGTTLTYAPFRPTDCPSTLIAGQVAECGPLANDFVVEGTQEFAVSAFLPSSGVNDPSGQDHRGDPSQSTVASTEQYRESYLFLAPNDFELSYAVVTGPQGAKVQIDDLPVTDFTLIGKGQGVWRWRLGDGQGGAHQLASDTPVGLQVIGYGEAASYQYPGGINARPIAPPPPPLR